MMVTSTARLLALAALCAAGCHAAPTTVRVTLTAAAGVAADDITLTVFDRNGRVVDSAALGGSDRLPGDVVVMVSAGAGEARAVAIATSAGVPVGEAAGRVPVLPSQEMPLGLQLVAGAMPDADHDGVPDVIDNCPTRTNADQISSAGDNTGDVCRGASDGGVVGNDPGLGDMGSGGGGGGGGGNVPPAGCGNGVLEAGEDCDQGAANSDDPAAASTCTTMCKKRATCGSVSGAAGAKIDPTTGHCYVAWPGPINFASAQRDCQGRGGSLAVVTSSAENTIVNAISGLSQMWLGLEITHAATDSFHWVDGEPFLYSAFAPNEPNNGAANGGRTEDCVAHTVIGWADLPCGFPATGNLPSSPTFALGFVCETSCGNAILEPGEECDGGPGCTATCQLKRPCTEAGGVVSPINGHCYFVQTATVDYSHALSSTCPAGTHLATLADISESEAGQLAISGSADAWIALRASSQLGVYAWGAPSSEAFDSTRYHGFAGNEPNETGTPNCVRLVDGQGWKDITCGNNFNALCERE
jgi:hypothetical protein